MTSKNFKSTEGGFSIGIHPVTDGVQFRITNMRGNYQQFNTPASVAAEQALAILEAAVGESSRQSAYSERAIDNLRSEVDRMKLEDAEAKDKAKLEAEALEFLHVAQKYNNFTLTESWNDFRDGGTKLLYMNMARRAREMRAEK
ncbi:hypothetical protein ACLQ8T_05635 [Glutamicibacter sp. FR1]|uniref:hypothetical protein n=1 Tax=Glutamicibacter sp. FR1 TaxID=3393744 RepID=UPI0039AFB591